MRQLQTLNATATSAGQQAGAKEHHLPGGWPASEKTLPNTAAHSPNVLLLVVPLQRHLPNRVARRPLVLRRVAGGVVVLRPLLFVALLALAACLLVAAAAATCRCSRRLLVRIAVILILAVTVARR